MLPYGIEKCKGGIHPHNECDICSGQPPLTRKRARQSGKKEIQSQLSEYEIGDTDTQEAANEQDN